MYNFFYIEHSSVLKNQVEKLLLRNFKTINVKIKNTQL